MTSTPAGNYVSAAALLYPANINPENPIGPMQSIEHALRKLDSLTENDELEIERLQKQLAEYKEQANRPFEHDAELKELLVRQAELNKALDLDKNAVQAAPDDLVEEQTTTDLSCSGSASFRHRVSGSLTSTSTPRSS